MSLLARHKEIVKVMREHGAPMSSTQIAEQVGLSRRVLTGTCGLLFELEIMGQVSRTGRKYSTRWTVR